MLSIFLVLLIFTERSFSISWLKERQINAFCSLYLLAYLNNLHSRSYFNANKTTKDFTRTEKVRKKKNNYMKSYGVIKQLVLTKKSFEQQAKALTYTFLVHSKANKFQIGQAIIELEKICSGQEVKIEKIRTCLKRPVKQKKSLLQKFPGANYTKLEKKAYIQLKPGYRLTIGE